MADFDLYHRQTCVNAGSMSDHLTQQGTLSSEQQYVYVFGASRTEGDAHEKSAWR